MTTYRENDAGILVPDTPIKVKTVQKVCERYNLGTVSEEPVLEHGDASYNLRVETSNGTYMVRCPKGSTSDKSKERRELEHQVTGYLSQHDFPYTVPTFAQDSEDQKIIEVDGHLFDSYRRLQGEVGDESELFYSNEITDAIAHYHRIIKDFGVPTGEPLSWTNRYDSNNTLEQRLESTLEQLRHQRASETEKFMFRHVNPVLNTTRKIKASETPNKPSIITYADFHPGNLVYSKTGVITGVIDFGDVTPGSEEEDFRKMPIRSSEELESVLSRYRAINPLNDEKAAQIIPAYLMHQIELIMRTFHSQQDEPQKLRKLEAKIDNFHEAAKHYMTS